MIKKPVGKENKTIKKIASNLGVHPHLITPVANF